MQEILKKAVISEKGFAAQESGKYVFHVTPAANKDLIKKEVERLFKVEVLNVQTINIPGKLKRIGRIYGRRNPVRKAIITVKKGQKIEEFKI